MSGIKIVDDTKVWVRYNTDLTLSSAVWMERTEWVLLRETVEVASVGPGKLLHAGSVKR